MISVLLRGEEACAGGLPLVEWFLEIVADCALSVRFSWVRFGTD